MYCAESVPPPPPRGPVRVLWLLSFSHAQSYQLTPGFFSATLACILIYLWGWLPATLPNTLQSWYKYHYFRKSRSPLLNSCVSGMSSCFRNFSQFQIVAAGLKTNYVYSLHILTPKCRWWCFPYMTSQTQVNFCSRQQFLLTVIL